MNEEEMDAYAAEFTKIPGMPKPIKLRVYYDAALQRITGREYDPVIMGEGSTFMYLLQDIFMEHPSMKEKYSSGTLIFEIGESPPKPHTPLFDGDIVKVCSPSSQER